MNRIFLFALMSSLGSHVFAEEALVTGYHLRPAAATVMTGKSIKVKLVYCQVVDTSGRKKAEQKQKPRKQEDDELTPLGLPEKGGKEQIDDDLAPLPTLRLVCEDDADAGKHLGDLAPPVTPKNVKWEVSSGQGKVSGDKSAGTYRAPAKKPQPNEATVSATVTYNAGKEKTILLSRITILDEVKAYRGTFRMHDVAINAEYTTDMAGDITFDFSEYYDVGGWREYEGKGTATYLVKRQSCTNADFAAVPVEGRLKVHDDGRYEFEIGLVSDAQVVTHCKRHDAKWQEEITPAGAAMNSGDPCAMKKFVPHYDDPGKLSLSRKGACSLVRDAYDESWSFSATH